MGHGADRGLVLVNVFEGALCSLSYVSVESAVQAVLRLGRGALLAKVDIRSAYRNIPVHPDDRWLLGLYWDGATYIYTVLPFGLRSAPKIFNSVVDALEWVVRAYGVTEVCHYLDDFLVAGAPGSSQCTRALSTLLWDPVPRLVGFPDCPGEVGGSNNRDYLPWDWDQY